MKHSTKIMVISTVINQIENKEIIINKNYQRNYVWGNTSIQSQLIGSILMKAPIGTLILYERKNIDHELEIEIVDGQQRLITIKNYIEGRFPLNKGVSEIVFRTFKKAIQKYATQDGEKESIRIFNKLNNNNIDPTYFLKLPKFLQKEIENYNLNGIIITDSTDDEIQKYFSVVQNQEKLKAGELINALPKNFVKNYFTDNFLDKISKTLNFNDERMDILKQLNLLVGVSKNKIRFGIADNGIFKYAESLKDEDEDEDIKVMFESIIDDFSIDRNPIHKKKFSVFSLKLYFLSHLFQNKSFQKKDIIEKRKIILEIIEYTSLFNSNDLEKRTKIPKEIFNDAEQVWKLCKTTHSKKDLKNIFENNFYKLATYISK